MKAKPFVKWVGGNIRKCYCQLTLIGGRKLHTMNKLNHDITNCDIIITIAQRTDNEYRNSHTTGNHKKYNLRYTWPKSHA